jgi:hypothetical protein
VIYHPTQPFHHHHGHRREGQKAVDDGREDVRSDRQDSSSDGRASGAPRRPADDAQRSAEDQQRHAGPHHQDGGHGWHQIDEVGDPMLVQSLAIPAVGSPVALAIVTVVIVPQATVTSPPIPSVVKILTPTMASPLPPSGGNGP